MRSVLLIPIAALALSSCNSTWEEREIGYKGRARVNPWLAAERFAEQMEWDVRSVISWTAPEWDDSVWVIPAPILGNESYTQRTEEWVLDGGHLILLVDYTAPETNDWLGRFVAPVLEPALTEMLRRSGIELVGEDGDDVKAELIEFKGRTFKVNAWSGSSVALAGGEPGVFASVESGEGRVSVVTDGRLFRNRWIDEYDHAAFLNALIDAGEYEGAVGFMRGSSLSLWALLRNYLWPVLIALAVWLGLWLWKNFTRFGPLEAAAPPPVARGYEHHLEALGDFQWRLDRAASLLAPLREKIVELGQRASIRAGCRDDDFFQFLADRSGLPRERVFRALAETAPADAAILMRTTSDLQQLLKVLDYPFQS